MSRGAPDRPRARERVWTRFLPRPLSPRWPGTCILFVSAALGPKPGGFSKSQPNCTQHSTLQSTSVLQEHPNSAHCAWSLQNVPQHCMLHPEPTECTPTLQVYPTSLNTAPRTHRMHPDCKSTSTALSTPTLCAAPQIQRMHPDSAQGTLTSRSARLSTAHPDRRKNVGLPRGASQTGGPAWPASPSGRPCRTRGLGLPLPRCRVSSTAPNPRMSVPSWRMRRGHGARQAQLLPG